jgi:hypothetical protein
MTPALYTWVSRCEQWILLHVMLVCCMELTRFESIGSLIWGELCRNVLIFRSASQLVSVGIHSPIALLTLHYIPLSQFALN